MQFFTKIVVLALAAAVVAAPTPNPISQEEIDKIEQNASRPIDDVIAEQNKGLTAADCAGKTTNACILAGFSDDPSQ